MKKGDFVVAGVILVLTAAIALTGGLSDRRKARFVSVTRDGDVIRTIDLDALTAAREYAFESNGVHLLVEAEAGRVRVSESTCPDQICVRAGWLTRPGRAVACVPARVSLTLAGEADTDAVLR